MFRVVRRAGVGMLAAVCGCFTPAIYESEPLPRFLVDPVEQATPSGAATPVVPVERRPAVTLADAVQECVLNNMRIKSGEEKIRAAQADYISESLIPNSQLMVDAQLLPVTTINFDNQAGPPQYDAIVTVPIDWFLFGKRVAAQAASRLNIDVAQAEFTDLLRKEIAQTVDAFYDALEADQALKLAQVEVEALENLKQIAGERGNADVKSSIDAQRVQLAVLDSQRELRKRRAAAETTKAKLQARIGRPPDTPDFVVKGTLAVRATAPLLTINDAWTLAEKYRPDLLAARRAICAADAAIERERRRAHAQVSVATGPDYQDQVRITGFRNAWLWTTSITTTLPFTDRNQGKILAAESNARNARASLQVAITEARAEVEQALAEYTEALAGVTGADVASLETARSVRDTMLAAYRRGEKDLNLLDALDAEKAYRDRLRNTLANITDYWQALNKLNAAIGARVLTAQEADKEQIVDEAKQKADQK